ncbi:CbiX/SirB N-terminal domain-containing protein [Desulfoscipio sp. XC116]|uniref:sirohydrochlorin chelatase n=1 Tax=Desulfoscipio sp. XC116 TaxID=3144975 RepID=UPI00325ACD23
MKETGVIILSHGSRLPEAQAALQDITCIVASKATEDFLIESASLQINQPDLPTAIARIVKRGAKRVVVVPLFLYPGLHIQKDVPEIIAAQSNIYKDISITMSEHIGADPRLQEIIMDRVRGAII